MPGFARLDGPAPAPPGALFCALCAGLAKFAAMKDIGPEVTSHEVRGDGTRAWPLALPEPPALAVAWGLVPQLGAALPLCWTHLAAIDNRASGILPATGMPPGPVLLDGH